MRGTAWIIGAVLALVLAPGGAQAQAQPDNRATPLPAQPVPVGGSDYAVGGGTETFEGRTLHFAFSAHDNSPNPPTGYVVPNNVAAPPLFTGGTDKIEGPVQCLAVVGDIANLVFTVKKTTATYVTVGQQIAVFTQDFGNPNNPSNPDRFGWAPDTFFIQQICNGAAFGSEPGMVTQGNVVVHDPVAALLPCPSMTDNTTYSIDTSCNLYTNTGTSTSPIWTLMQ